jgi:hypothetical protein
MKKKKKKEEEEEVADVLQDWSSLLLTQNNLTLILMPL